MTMPPRPAPPATRPAASWAVGHRDLTTATDALLGMANMVIGEGALTQKQAFALAVAAVYAGAEILSRAEVLPQHALADPVTRRAADDALLGNLRREIVDRRLRLIEPPNRWEEDLPSVPDYTRVTWYAPVGPTMPQDGATSPIQQAGTGAVICSRCGTTGRWANPAGGHRSKECAASIDVAKARIGDYLATIPDAVPDGPL